jgi:hypothetical protein
VTHHLKDQLRAADPVAYETGLSAIEIDAMRRAVVSAAGDHPRGRSLPGRLVLWMTIAVTAALAFWISTVIAPVRRESIQPQATESRQLQFETPGGTRVVWVLNSRFNLQKDRNP